MRSRWQNAAADGQSSHTVIEKQGLQFENDRLGCLLPNYMELLLTKNAAVIYCMRFCKSLDLHAKV